MALNAELRRELATAPTAETRHRLALVQLAAGRPETAVDLLAEALEERSEAEWWSDLAAAFGARARTRGDSVDHLAALDAAEEALALQTGLPAALFNRALALEHLGLRAAARRAWNDVVEREPAMSAWGAEAEQRLAGVARPEPLELWPERAARIGRALEAGEVQTARALVVEDPQRATEYAELELLPVWGEAVLEGQTERQARLLEAAVLLGRLLTEVTLDPMVEHATAQLVAAKDAPARQRLARGLTALAEGRRTYEEQRYKDAVEPLERAAAELGPHVEGSWALYHLLICGHWGSDPEDSIRRFEALHREAQSQGYLRLAAYSRWMATFLRLNRAELSHSLAAYREVLAGFEMARQSQDTAIAHLLVADVHRSLGDGAEYWRHLFAALQLQDEIARTRWRITLYDHGARAARMLGHPRAALAFEDEAVNTTRAGERPDPAVHAHLIRAQGRAHIGDREGAIADLDEARGLLARIDDPDAAASLQGHLWSVEGRVWAATDPRAAVGVLDRALAYYDLSGSELLRAELWLRRGRLHRRLGEVDLAEVDFQTSIEILETHRAKVREEGSRISYFEQAREVFDEMVELELERGDPAAALAMAERGRARELRTNLAPPHRRSPGDGLPEGVVALYFVVLEERLLVFTLSRHGLDLAESPLKARRLERRVGEFRAALGGGTEGYRTLGRALYDDLLAPVETHLKAAEILVALPDKALHELPFAALVNPAGRFLIEEHAIVASPAAALLSGTAADGEESLAHASAFVVGDPAIDGKQHPALTRLPGAAAEARRVSGLYPDTRLLLGAQATKERFLALAGDFEILHFAGHAVANEEFPELSRLLLAAPASGSDASSELWAHEIADHGWPRTRLVVLSACSTARARISIGEGVLSLARPFLAAGVPQVVASLWEVDDDATAELLQRFHRELAGGRTPATALRAAQLALLTSTEERLRSPAAWAAFQIYGRLSSQR